MEEIEKKNNIKEIVEWIICILIAVILALLVRHYICTPTVVKQESMYPTLKDGERLFLNRWSITIKKDLEVGDIITFEAPSVRRIDSTQYDPNNPVAIYKNEPKNIFSKFIYYVLEIDKESYIKRVIGVEGDKILIQNGEVYRNGEKLPEEYLPEGVKTERTGLFYDLTVPEGYVFAVGDNRGKSQDCREFGCIPVEKVESKVLIRFWPLNKMGKV